MYRSGFVSISGQPNVGKSTILNGLLGEKLAITSKRPETTRDNIRGILTGKSHQIVFVDTPGIHKPHDLLGRTMVIRASSSLMESDIILLITEKRTAFNADDQKILQRLPSPGKKDVILVINKVDQVKDKRLLLPVIKKASAFYPFRNIIPISALDPEDLDRLLSVILEHLPPGPQLYPEDQLTDRDTRFHVQELIREKVLSLTFHEVPHSIAVLVEKIERNKKGILKIYATIFVEKPSQKAIIVGHKGSMVKKIGTLARMDIEQLLDEKVFLSVWVKVYRKWKKDAEALREMGYSE